MILKSSLICSQIVILDSIGDETTNKASDETEGKDMLSYVCRRRATEKFRCLLLLEAIMILCEFLVSSCCSAVRRSMLSIRVPTYRMSSLQSTVPATLYSWRTMTNSCRENNFCGCKFDRIFCFFWCMALIVRIAVYCTGLYISHLLASFGYSTSRYYQRRYSSTTINQVRTTNKLRRH